MSKLLFILVTLNLTKYFIFIISADDSGGSGDEMDEGGSTDDTGSEDEDEADSDISENQEEMSVGDVIARAAEKKVCVVCIHQFMQLIRVIIMPKTCYWYRLLGGDYTLFI